MTKKTVLITGCSSGFGLSTTKALLHEGWQVIATARYPEACAELNALQHESLIVLQLDVTQPVHRLAIQQYITQQLEGRLDCLLNNAGYGLLGPLEELTEEQIRHQLEVNVFSVILLTKMCLPFLKKTRGRLITVSSLLGYMAVPYHSLYVTSKYALEGFSEALYYELAHLGVQVTLVEPGSHRTQFGANAIVSTSQPHLAGYQLQKDNFLRFRNRLKQRKNGSSDTFAHHIVRLLNKSVMPLRVRVGYDAHFLYFIKRIMPTYLFTRLFHFVYKRIFLVSS